MSAGPGELERELLEAAARASPARVAELLDEGFVEFGSSGRVWDRAGIIAGLAAEGGGVARRAEDMRVRMLAPDVALVTYRAVRETEGAAFRTLRSSVWVRRDGAWRMAFHQGTQEAG